MAAKRPRTRDDFAEVHGVGRAKLERYATIFMTVVREQAP
jgi:ATP-dependent DNA helicase RecQ